MHVGIVYSPLPQYKEFIQEYEPIKGPKTHEEPEFEQTSIIFSPLPQFNELRHEYLPHAQSISPEIDYTQSWELLPQDNSLTDTEEDNEFFLIETEQLKPHPPHTQAKSQALIVHPLYSREQRWRYLSENDSLALEDFSLLDVDSREVPRLSLRLLEKELSNFSNEEEMLIIGRAGVKLFANLVVSNVGVSASSAALACLSIPIVGPMAAAVTRCAEIFFQTLLTLKHLDNFLPLAFREMHDLRMYKIRQLFIVDGKCPETYEEVKNAYHSLSKRYHPDKHHKDVAFTTCKMQEINDGYKAYNEQWDKGRQWGLY